MKSSLTIRGGIGNRWETLEPGKHPTGLCSAKPLVAVIQASGGVAFCILHRNRRDIAIGNIHKQSFADLWFSDAHVRAWQGFDVTDCPNPCKFYGYNEIVQAAAAGVEQTAPPHDEVAHHNFV